MTHSVFFRYKNGHSFIHTMPSTVKILLMILLGVVSFYVPPFTATGIFIFVILFSLVYLRFSIKEIFTDNVPTLLYVLMLYMVCLVSNIIAFCKIDFNSAENLVDTFSDKIIFLIKPDSKFFPLSIHLALSVEITSVFFRCTTPVQFNQAFSSIESFVTRKNKTPVADTISCALNFIPRIATLWSRIDKAWNARGGKKNVKRITKLTPVLFKNSMSDAYKKSLARMNRE